MGPMTQPHGYPQPPHPGYGQAVYTHNGRTHILPGEQQYKVETVRHTGVVVLWFAQDSTFTGTYAQCHARIMASLLHCLLLGWWGILSMVFFNPLAIVRNLLALSVLKREARMVREFWASQPHHFAPGPQYHPPLR